MSEPASKRVKVRRGPKKGRYDQETIHSVLDRGLVAHVAFAAGEDEVYCVPTLFARVADRLYIHGSAASRTLRALAAGAPACVTVTILDGLVLARSVFEHSANYEAVMTFGVFSRVEDKDERVKALEAFTEKVLPGRWSEVREPTRQELKGTSILGMPIIEAAAKVRSGPPDDDETPDAAIDTWAGVIPLQMAFGSPVPSPGLTPGTPLSDSVRRLLDGGPTRTRS
jgi:nitroimidazol reductase NimA-like FMN-containing flavoprotein (pyridoxamine 5'-phosphate oxidase superfamily)